MDVAWHEPILTRCCQTIFCRCCIKQHFASGGSNDSQCPMCKVAIKGFRRYFRDSKFDWLQDMVLSLMNIVKCMESRVNYTILTQITSSGVCKPFRTALSYPMEAVEDEIDNENNDDGDHEAYKNNGRNGKVLSINDCERGWDDLLLESSHVATPIQFIGYVPIRLLRSVMRESYCNFSWVNFKAMRNFHQNDVDHDHDDGNQGKTIFYMTDVDSCGRIYRSTSYFEALLIGLPIISIKWWTSCILENKFIPIDGFLLARESLVNPRLMSFLSGCGRVRGIEGKRVAFGEDLTDFDLKLCHRLATRVIGDERVIPLISMISLDNDSTTNDHNNDIVVISNNDDYKRQKLSVLEFLDLAEYHLLY